MTLGGREELTSGGPDDSPEDCGLGVTAPGDGVAACWYIAGVLVLCWGPVVVLYSGYIDMGCMGIRGGGWDCCSRTGLRLAGETGLDNTALG